MDAILAMFAIVEELAKDLYEKPLGKI